MSSSCKKSKIARKHRGGFALVMALVLVGLATLCLMRLANRSLGRVLDSRRAAADLQQKWAEQSCQLELLKEPERRFEDWAAEAEAAGNGWPFPASAAGVFRIANLKLRVLLADEQAKPSFNKFYDKNAAEARAVLMDGAFQVGRQLPIRIRPQLRSPSDPDRRSFTNWGQLVELGQLTPTPEATAALNALFQRFTCAGDGRLNITRAPDLALQYVVQTALTSSETTDLLEARTAYAGELGDFLRTLKLPGRKIAALRRLLTERSSCYSLWLEIRQSAKISLIYSESDPTRSYLPPVQVYRWP